MRESGTMLRISGGRIFDPKNGRAGEEGDLFLRDGRVVESLPAGCEEIDARRLIVMPGAIDPHTHVSGTAVGAARLACPGNGRPAIPTLPDTGRLYAAMGYTTIMEAATAPIAARAAHDDLDAVPIVDKGIYVLMGNNEIALRFIRDGRYSDLRDYVAWLLEATRGYGVKVANPGGVEEWKRGPGCAHGDGPPALRDDARAILRALAGAVAELGLPHPIHLHMNGLGEPGNAALSLETMDLLRDLPVHYTHLQYHAYGGRTTGGLRSRARALAEWVNAHPAATVDVGQVVFGPAITLSADAPAQHRLHRATGRKWINLDIEVETGCGVVPHDYREDRLLSAVQWAIGLEILLLVEDPWRVFLTTDHPNGGPFTAYPSILRLLMDRRAREEAMARAHPRLRERTDLAGIAREYTLEEIAIITRAGPARALGLDRKGHLAAGADADVVLYNPSGDLETMFARPVAVVKDGVVVAREGEVVGEIPGRTLRAAPPRVEGRARAAFERGIRDAFEAYYTMPFEDYAIPEEPGRREEAVPARRRAG